MLFPHILMMVCMDVIIIGIGKTPMELGHINQEIHQLQT